jgi:hypothetical protein
MSVGAPLFVNGLLIVFGSLIPFFNDLGILKSLTFFPSRYMPILLL